jgi:hypothetical protein
VGEIVDSAEARGLPGDALMRRALEGASKGADAGAIIRAVRRLAGELGQARDLLSPAASPRELAAGADALRAGVSSEALRRAPAVLGSRDLTVALSVIADLAIRGVPADSAASMVIAAARSVPDDELLAVERDVGHEIAAGAAPLTAAVGRLDTGPQTAHPSGGGSTPVAPAPRKP